MKRVAAYCRVSTDKNDQVNSLDSQKRYFAQYIERSPLWELYEIYVDEGITGTSTKKRAAFNRMIADAQARRFDLILTKEISRFARNTLDSILYTRQLKELGIGVIFLSDNINTLEPDAELRLTIMSSIAQEESRKTSDRVKWGQKRRMEQGVVFGRDLLGYDVRGGKLRINEQGAKTVRAIFHKFVMEGKGAHTIARELCDAGIPTATYMSRWSGTVILRVLRNEKYCGDLIQKKTITPNYLNHEKKYNRGEEAFVVLRDHHAPIIERDLFERAQRELARRAPSGEQKTKHSNRYCFSGRIKCGGCGSSYLPRTKKRQDGSVYKAWRCGQAARYGSRKFDQAGNETGCDNHSVNEEDLRLLLKQVINSLIIDQKALTDDLLCVVQSVLRRDTRNEQPERLEQKLLRLEEKRQSLLELYINQEISKEDYQRMAGRYETQMKEIEQARHSISPRAAPDIRSLDEISETIRALAQGDEWNEVFYRQLLEQICVQPDGTLEVTLQQLPYTFRFLMREEKALRAHEAE